MQENDKGWQKVAQKRQGHRVLILGAGGKVGRLVRAVWAAQPVAGVTFVPVVRRDTGERGQVIWAPGQPPEELPEADSVLALWGVTPSPGADLDKNTKLALCAMDIGRAVGADRVLHCSSAAVYAPEPAPLSETTLPVPGSPYGQAKLDMERAVHGSASAGKAGICLRIGNVAGAESLFGAMMRSDDVHLDRFSDGAGPERSYIAPLDLAHVLVTLATCPPCDVPAILNVAAPVPTAMEAIARAAGRRVIWRPAPAGAARRVVLDTARLNTLCPLGTETACADHLVSDWLRWKEPE